MPLNIDPNTISHADITINNDAYERLFLSSGYILFELTLAENEQIKRAVSQLEEFDNRDPRIDQKEWIQANITPLPSSKPLAVFVFLITQWHPTTIVGNAESPNPGYVYVSITKEGAGH